jgi:hypothetical protein
MRLAKAERIGYAKLNKIEQELVKKLTNESAHGATGHESA